MVGRITAALTIGILLLVGLSWLLARLVWLYIFFGVFFFLLAGLLTGAIVFPVLRAARPLRTSGVVWLCLALTLAGWAISLGWEYRYIVHSAGDQPHFSAARNALVKAGHDPALVETSAASAFREMLRRDHPPGGLIGYLRWMMAGGRSELSLSDLPAATTQPFTDRVSVPHHGWRWPLRAAVSMGLLFLGLWWQLGSLRSSVPLSNVIDPDEADELEMEEIWEAGEAGYRTFDHTADVGLEARGKNWSALLEHSARGLMATIGAFVPRSSDSGEVTRVSLTAGTREELLRDWLAELLYQFETRRACIGRVRIVHADERQIEADITWRAIDESRSRYRREVKAVTYHDLRIEPWGRKGLCGRVILDI